ncbi:helix-turn-helix domain-containing protein [Spirochaeta africana]|uniref:Helix-turn-helix domain-containing protein n=1 Tax=Spirochaeta africana (strain ATCC 700263 / DSM 8902 / Z-7692) TaxID=889378 RepID=H9UIT2_SPIAZ|nr:helix-turn-helix domain-containing protein [Spirochaeta africana]AFG37425.1 hypothetical protein Spiaf_1359 [Spirochaeta africana DSM 8902]
MPSEFEGLTVYTAEEIAQKLDIAIGTVREKLRDGKLHGRKLGKKWFVPAESLREYFLAEAEAEEHSE